jgi:hypothetical protein
MVDTDEAGATTVVMYAIQAIDKHRLESVLMDQSFTIPTAEGKDNVNHHPTAWKWLRTPSRQKDKEEQFYVLTYVIAGDVEALWVGLFIS